MYLPKIAMLTKMQLAPLGVNIVLDLDFLTLELQQFRDWKLQFQATQKSQETCVKLELCKHYADWGQSYQTQ